MSNEIYEKVEKICKKIDAFTEKGFSVKNEVKTKSYSAKIKSLISMIEKAEATAQSTAIETEEIVNNNEIDNNKVLEGKYNPYSENFCYKERLEQLNGDIHILITELKEQDKIGYRNAYIINEIEKYTITKSNIKVRKKVSLWGKIRNLFRK